MGSDIFKKELGSICDALADLAQEPRDPNPGWVPCMDKIRARLARADAAMEAIEEFRAEIAPLKSKTTKEGQLWVKVSQRIKAYRSEGKAKRDWTVDPTTGRSNSSEEYGRLVGIVKKIISGSAHDLLGGRHESVARTIVSRLAHAERVGPLNHAEV